MGQGYKRPEDCTRVLSKGCNDTNKVGPHVLRAVPSQQSWPARLGLRGPHSSGKTCSWLVAVLKTLCKAHGASGDTSCMSCMCMGQTTLRGGVYCRSWSCKAMSGF